MKVCELSSISATEGEVPSCLHTMDDILGGMYNWSQGWACALDESLLLEGDGDG